MSFIMQNSLNKYIGVNKAFDVSKIAVASIKSLAAIALMWTLSFSGNALAATLVTDGSGQLLGVNDIEVNGTLYNVDFLEGSCYTFFAPCLSNDNLDFDINLAQDASWALKEQVFDVPEWSLYTSNPSMTFGCEDLYGCTIFTAYSVNSDPMGNAQFFNGDGLFFFDYVNTCGLCYRSDDTTSDPTTVFAIWEEASGATTVPVPAAAWLFGSALIGLRMLRRRN